MIPAHGNWYAVFRSPFGSLWRRSIVAWSDEGIPLVAGNDGVLIPAKDVGDLESVAEISMTRPAVPASGSWEAVYRTDEDGADKEITLPVEAWSVLGEPLVALEEDRAQWRLTCASEADPSSRKGPKYSFAYVQRSDQRVVPAQPGWVVQHVDRTGEVLGEEPVVALGPENVWTASTIGVLPRHRDSLGDNADVAESRILLGPNDVDQGDSQDPA